MFSLNDERWYQLTGGYKTPFDPRPALAKLSKLQDEVGAWEELWEELHHQGDVGDASYAAIPELVRIHRIGGIARWNTYSMAAIIDLARTERGIEIRIAARQKRPSLITAKVMKCRSPKPVMRFRFLGIGEERGPPFPKSKPKG